MAAYKRLSPICRLSHEAKLKHGHPMMRFLPFAALLLAACSQEPAVPESAIGIYAGEGRNRLCIAGDGTALRAGVIAYGSGDSNCSASGRIEQAQGGLILVPRGEGDCRIPLMVEGSEVRVGSLPAACSYYCGPGAALSGISFTRLEKGEPVTDLAGDPLC